MDSNGLSLSFPITSSDTHHQSDYHPLAPQEHGLSHGLSPHTWKPDPAQPTDGKTQDGGHRLSSHMRCQTPQLFNALDFSFFLENQYGGSQ